MADALALDPDAALATASWGCALVAIVSAHGMMRITMHKHKATKKGSIRDQHHQRATLSRVLRVSAFF